jgi:hypothetical protein
LTRNFANGTTDAIVQGDGRFGTILQTETIEDANALMQAEPMIRRSLGQFNLRPRAECLDEAVVD